MPDNKRAGIQCGIINQAQIKAKMERRRPKGEHPMAHYVTKLSASTALHGGKRRYREKIVHFGNELPIEDAATGERNELTGSGNGRVMLLLRRGAG